MPAALTVFLIVKHEHMGYCMYVLILLQIRYVLFLYIYEIFGFWAP